LSETDGNLSGRTTPSSFRDSPIGWGMSLLCGGIRSGNIDSREALVNYYQQATFTQQLRILDILSGNDKEKRFGLLAESMFHACANNFLENNNMRVRSQSTLMIYDSIEQFNEVNTMKEQVKKYKLSSVAKQLTLNNSQLIADNILNVCGALGMPYEAMLALLNRPDIVYQSFKSTFGESITNVNGTNRGYALWVLYAATRQCYVNATSYVVDDVFFVDVHETHSQDEDLDKVLQELNVSLEPEATVEGYKFVPNVHEGDLVTKSSKLVPDAKYVQDKFTMLVNKCQARYWENHPEELQAHLLQLAYVLNPYQEEFSAILGLLQQTAKFVPNISCILGPVPASLPELIASHDNIRSLHTHVAELDGTVSIKNSVVVLNTALQRTFRHYVRHFKEKDWYIDGKLLQADQKARMKSKLFDYVLDVKEYRWDEPIDNGWG